MTYSISSENSKELLSRWALNAKRSQFANFEAARNFSQLHMAIGIPVVILTSIVGTSLFASLESDVNHSYRIILALISVISAVLASLQTFLNYGERASRHRAIAVEYGAIKRHIQELLSRSDVTNQEVSSVREKMNMLGKDAPEVPSKFHQMAKQAVPEIHMLAK